MSDETTPHDATPGQGWFAEPTPPAASPTPRPKRHLAWAALGVAALGVAGGGLGAVALAGDGPTTTPTAAVGYGQEGGQRPAGEGRGPGGLRGHGTGGTIASIDGTGFTVERPAREAEEGEEAPEPTSVTTDDETVVLDIAEGEVADVAVGDRVLAMGEAADDGTVTARRIVDLGDIDPETFGGPFGGHRPGAEAGTDTDGEAAEPPADAPEPPADAPERAEGAPDRAGFRPAAGEVTAVDGATITVTTEDGEEVTVATDADTTVTTVTEAAVSDLAVGDTVGVRGEAADDGTVAADVVIRGDLAGGRGFGLGGPGGGHGGRGPGGGGPGMGRGPWGDGERPDAEQGSAESGDDGQGSASSGDDVPTTTEG